jgi:pyridoxine 5-phosphate synthase
MNLEMAVTEEMLGIAENTKPQECCLVPERREELTTEGGLDVYGQKDRIRQACARLAAAGVRVSLFIDAEPRQIDAAAETGAPVIEIHTGHYADAVNGREREQELARILQAVSQACAAGLQVNAGHGLDYENVVNIARIPDISELNIGHSIVSRAVFTGLKQAVSDMKRIMTDARAGAGS